MKKLSAVVFLLTMGATQARADMTSIYTPYELDIQEAHLNKQWKRVEEFAAAHAKFVGIKKDLVVAGYENAMEQWYKDQAEWFRDWNKILATFQGDTLADKQVQDDTVKLVKSQLIALDNLRQRILEIRAKGELAKKALADLPRFPPDYIDVDETSTQDTYRPHIELYAQQIELASKNITDAQAIFDVNLTKKLEEMTKGLDRAMTSKVAALAIRFPELNQAVKRINDSLEQIRRIDVAINHLRARAQVISNDITQERIYTARASLAKLKTDTTAELKKIKDDPANSATLVTYSEQSMTGVLNALEGQIETQLKTRSAKDIFATYYENQLYGPTGLITPCLSEDRPNTIDCNLLRTIQGFTYAQLLELTDPQAAYMESILEKARLGIFRP